MIAAGGAIFAALIAGGIALVAQNDPVGTVNYCPADNGSKTRCEIVPESSGE